jgi:hypothetical protein
MGRKRFLVSPRPRWQERSATCRPVKKKTRVSAGLFDFVSGSSPVTLPCSHRYCVKKASTRATPVAPFLPRTMVV